MHEELITPLRWCTFINYLSTPACLLNKLCIADNRIGPEGAECLEDSLMHFHASLVELDLRECDIDDDGAYVNFPGFSSKLDIEEVEYVHSPFKLTDLDFSQKILMMMRQQC